MLSAMMRCNFEKYSERVAISIDDCTHTYSNLLKIADDLQGYFSYCPSPSPIGIVTTRSLAAYSAILEASLDDRPYVPLNADYPLERLTKIIESAGISLIVLADTDADRADDLRTSVRSPLDFVLINDDGHIEIDVDTRTPPLATTERAVTAMNAQDRPAYLMFTSGTTGEPKGIMISQANLEAYLQAIEALFDFNPDDRFSQFFNLTFDLSVHDVFVTWMNGACLCVPNSRELMNPVAFAQKQQLTVWFSVPSTVSLAMRFRQLRAGSLPMLRHALFCGEALSGNVTSTFAAAAPNAALTNLYGPTEATIAITHHRISAAQNLGGEASAMPIGHPFPGQETLVLRDDLKPAGYGEIGELWLGGSQLAKGYSNNADETAAKFRRFTHPGRQAKAWYATGDLVEEHPEHGLIYRGRKDDQIKLHGHRIELIEVEEALRKAAATPLAFVATWPFDGSRQAEKLIAIVVEPHPPASEILGAMAKVLPPFMVPASITCVAEMAFNANGKLDRKTTLRNLMDETS